MNVLDGTLRAKGSKQISDYNDRRSWVRKKKRKKEMCLMGRLEPKARSKFQIIMTVGHGFEKKT